MNQSKIYFFKNNRDNVYLYSGYTGLILEWDPRIQKHLENEEYDEEANNCLQGRTGDSPLSPPSLPIKPALEMIVLFVTNQCNLTCSYCYERASGLHNMENLDMETLKETIVYFIKNFDYQNRINICFFGGEPLLNFSLIKESITVLEEIGNQHDIRFNYSLTTNGTLLNDEIINFIIRHNINIGISIDGPEIVHDLHRKYLDGRGSYRSIIENVAQLANYCDITARVTITDYRVDLIELYQELENVGFSTMKTECVVNPKFKISSDEFQYFRGNLQLFADYFIRNLKQRKIVNYADFLAVLKTLHLGAMPKFFPCNTGLNQYSVATDGSIYFCHRFMNLPNFKWGDAARGLNLEKRNQFLKSHMVTMRGLKRCENCWAQRMCGGTCYHASQVETGTTAEMSGFDCEFRKAIYEKALYIYASLVDEEKIFLDNMDACS